MNLRIRSIHGGQWKDEAFVSCSPLARLLAIGLRNVADDGGVFEWKPKTLKMELLPADDCDISELLSELTNTGQISQFTAGEKKYGYVRNFSKYQRPRNPKTIYPQPPSARLDVAEVQQKTPVNEDSNSPNGDIGRADVGCRMEEGDKTETVVSAKDAIVDDEILKFVADHNLPVDPAEQLERFNDWKLAKGRKFRNDRAAFRNWLRKAADIAREHPHSPSSSKNSPAPISYSEPWEQRMRGWRRSQFWDVAWGPRPGQAGCRVPPELLAEQAA